MANEHEHAIAVQRQALQQQAVEIDLALKELSGSKHAYRFVSGLLVETEVPALTTELTAKRESIRARLDALTKHVH